MIPLNPAAQEQKQPPRYAITIVHSLGGDSETVGVNNRGSASGTSSLPGGVVQHGYFWRDGVTTDLGTLGGPNSFAPEEWPPNERDEVAGFSDTSELDPYDENFCGPFSFLNSDPYICRAFVWRQGVKTLLPTLGGNNAAAVAINNRGQATGIAETNVVNPACASPQVFDFKAVIWGPTKDEIHELSPLPGDNEAVTTGINDNGRVVGTSAKCALGPFPIHAVLWEDGKPINLGTLGGAVFNIAFGINNRGQVVGGSDLPGDTIHHAFLWENGMMTDLGSILGLPVSQALSINNQGQVVGFSQDLSNNIIAWIWENGLMTDLNSLIPADSPWFLVEALGINDRAQIAGFAFNTSTGDTRGFILTPVQSSESSAQTARSTASKEPPALPEKVRRMLKRRMDARLHWASPTN